MSALLRRARFDAGLTPEQLGEKVGLSGMTIRRLEKGSNPTPATAKALADFFEVTPSEMFDRKAA